MRIYMNGVANDLLECFTPTELWFANSDCEDNLVVSQNCIRLEGVECESNVEGNEFSCRWKGVLLSYVNKDGEEIETEDFSIEKFIELTKDMKLENMGANFAFSDQFDALTVKLSKVELVSAKKEYVFPVKRIDKIEFQ